MILLIVLVVDYNFELTKDAICLTLGQGYLEWVKLNIGIAQN